MAREERAFVRIEDTPEGTDVLAGDHRIGRLYPPDMTGTYQFLADPQGPLAGEAPRRAFDTHSLFEAVKDLAESRADEIEAFQPGDTACETETR